MSQILKPIWPRITNLATKEISIASALTIMQEHHIYLAIKIHPSTGSCPPISFSDLAQLIFVFWFYNIIYKILKAISFLMFTTYPLMFWQFYCFLNLIFSLF
jgi:hypothetical protein